MNLLSTIFLAFVDIAPWMQFGLAGVTFITLATLLVMMMRKVSSRDKNSVDVAVMMKVREETLLEINKRDAQILELSSKVLDGLHTSSRALERMQDRMEELAEEVEEMKGIVARCPNVR